ncbi:MAG: polysaccharide biosynthesis/export family protein [Pigmentiphaga sp.]|nr:polysaccharide biosynthesis/export family protein [Pigmentiphaga sp.]
MVTQTSSLNLWKVSASLTLLTLVSGCALAPGNYLGIRPKANETDDYKYDISGAETVEDRADIHSITPLSVARLIEARQQQQAEPSPLLSFPNRTSTEHYSYKLGAQDVLLITVWNHPELNNPAGTLRTETAGRVIGEDGAFFYPYVGAIKAAGRTVQQVRDELAKKLQKYLVEPQVDVSVLEYRSQRAYVMGQVEQPGVVRLNDVPLTISDLVGGTGGFKNEADLKGATLTRNGNKYPVDLLALFYQGDVTQDIRIQPGDVLTIPENRYNKVFVLGEVLKPQSLLMPRGRLSLAEAISDTGGMNPLSSNAGQIYVIREGESGRPQIWHLDAKSPDALVLADRFDLEARDIVYVDPAGVARFSRVINNIIPTASFLRAVAND